MALADLIPNFISHIQYHENAIELQAKLYDLYKEQISKHVINKIYADINSKSARKSMIERLVPVNIVPGYIDKISKIYDEPPIRTLENPNDKDICRAPAGALQISK